MPHLLHLDSSIDPERSRSRAVTAAFATAWSGRGAPMYNYSLPSTQKAWLPALADQRGRADAEFAAATETAQGLARTLLG